MGYTSYNTNIDPSIARARQQTMTDAGYNLTGGVDGKWGNSSENNWNKFITSDAGKLWALTHDVNTGQVKPLTAGALMDYTADNLPENLKKRREDLTAKNTAYLDLLNSGYTFDNKTYGSNLYNNYVAAVNKSNSAANNKAYQDNLSNYGGSYITRREKENFDLAGQVLRGEIDARNLSSIQLNRLKRTLRKAKKIAGDGYNEHSFFSNTAAALNTPEAQLLAVNRLEEIKFDRYGGIISYSTYINM